MHTLIKSSGYKSQMFNFWAALLRLQTKQEKFDLGWHADNFGFVEKHIPTLDQVGAPLLKDLKVKDLSDNKHPFSMSAREGKPITKLFS